MSNVRAAERQAIERLYAEFYSKPSSHMMSEVARHILAPDWRGHGDFSGLAVTVDDMIAVYRGFGQAVPDIQVMPQQILNDGDLFVVRSRLSGTPIAPFLGFPATGKGFAILTIDLHRFVRGKIAETWHLEDWAGALRQMGVFDRN